MSKKKKQQPIPKQQQQQQEVFDWGELVKGNQETVKEILGKQLLVRELANVNIEAITGNKELETSLQGLMKTYTDLADECRKVALEHATVTTTVKNGDKDIEVGKVFKSGIITDDDERLEYIRLGSGYISIQEKLAYISSTAYLDIFTKLKLDTTSPEYKDMKKIVEEKPDGQ